MLSGATGHPGRLTIGAPRPSLPVRAEIVAQTHRAGGVPAHRRDATVGGAGPQREHGRRARRELVDPAARRDRLSVQGVDAERGPVPVARQILIGDRPLQHEDERMALAPHGIPERGDELVSGLKREHRVVEDDPGCAGGRSDKQLLKARIRRRRHRHRVPVAPETAGQPEDMDELPLGVQVCDRQRHDVPSSPPARDLRDERTDVGALRLGQCREMLVKRAVQEPLVSVPCDQSGVGEP